MKLRKKEICSLQEKEKRIETASKNCDYWLTEPHSPENKGYEIICTEIVAAVGSNLNSQPIWSFSLFSLIPKQIVSVPASVK